MWEEYRYDPLGRRVLVNTRTKDQCTTGNAFQCASATTRIGLALAEEERDGEMPSTFSHRGIHPGGSLVRMRGSNHALIAAMLICTTSCNGLGIRRTTKAKITEVLEQITPIGTPSTRVIAVLDSLGVEHSPYQPEERIIRGLWRRTSVGLFEERSVQARFEFDRKQLLVRYVLDEVITAM